MTPALQFKDLSLSINGEAILGDVNLALSPGKITGLVGRSGSGKSMTALAAMGLAPDSAMLSGAIELAGENLFEKSEKEMCAIRGRDIAMIFQEPMTALNPLHTIGAQVAETILVHSDRTKGEALAEAQALLERVGLPPETVSPARYPHELSGGQRQRVVIAIAIAMKPKVLIADEPTTALDVTTQAEILKLLKRLVSEDDIALLFITHDLAVISDMADRIAVMKDGRIVEEHEPQAFFADGLSDDANGLIARPIQRSKKAPAGGASILSADDVACVYKLPRRSVFARVGELRAVDGVSLNIRKGENIGLVGESGCGKSTLARALLGLASVAEGTIDIDGGAFPSADSAATRKLRRHIQIVFQDPYSSFNPRWTIGKIIAEPLHLLDAPPSELARKKRVAEALFAVGLMPSDAKKYPHEFSGGQRQRIAIARALITEPEIIVLDEATSALDVTSRNRILDLLMRLSEDRGVSYLFITHDLTVIRDVADRVLVMKEGRIVEEAATDDIFNRPQHAYTKSLIAAAPVIKWPVNASA